MADTLRTPNVIIEPLVGGEGELRVPETIVEPLAGGDPKLRAPNTVVEPLVSGDPNLRVPNALVEPLTSGQPNLRSPNAVVEPLVSGLGFLRQVLCCVEVLATGELEIMSAEVFPTLIGLSWSVHKKPLFSTRTSKQQAGTEVRSAEYPMPLWEFNLTYDYLPDYQDAGQDLNTNLRTLMGFFLSRQGSFDNFLFKDPKDYIVKGGLQIVGDAETSLFGMIRVLGGFPEIIGRLNTDVLCSFDSSAVDTGTSTVNVPNHGLTTADSPIAVVSTSALPGGLSNVTTYWLIAIDLNTIAFASSYANALAGTKVTLSSTGTGTDTVSRDIAVYDNGTLLDKTLYSLSLPWPNYLQFVTPPASGHLITADFWFYFNVKFLEDTEDFEQFMDNLWQLQKCDLMSVIP